MIKIRAMIYSSVLLLCALALPSLDTVLKAQTIEEVELQLGNLRSAYERRTDLVARVMEFAEEQSIKESQLWIEVQAARERAIGVSFELDSLREEHQVERFRKIQKDLGGGLTRLFDLLDSSDKPLDKETLHNLVAQWEGAENRIHVSRNDYNAAVRDYNREREKLHGIAGHKLSKPLHYLQPDN